MGGERRGAGDEIGLLIPGCSWESQNHRLMDWFGLKGP